MIESTPLNRTAGNWDDTALAGRQSKNVKRIRAQFRRKSREKIEVFTALNFDMWRCFDSTQAGRRTQDAGTGECSYSYGMVRHTRVTFAVRLLLCYNAFRPFEL